MEKRSYLDEESRQRYTRYFSVDFKKKRVRELEKNLVRVSDICRTYNVSDTAVYKWLYTYSSMAKKGVKQVVEAKSDTQRIQALEAKIKDLERLVGQKQIMIEFQDKVIEIAEEVYAVDIKKKFGSRPSSGAGVTSTKSPSR